MLVKKENVDIKPERVKREGAAPNVLLSEKERRIFAQKEIDFNNGNLRSQLLKKRAAPKIELNSQNLHERLTFENKNIKNVNKRRRQTGLSSNLQEKLHGLLSNPNADSGTLVLEENEDDEWKKFFHK